MILAQHARHKFFCKQKIIKKIDRNVPPLLRCQKTPYDCIGVRQRLLVRRLDDAQVPLDHQALSSKGSESLTLLNEVLPLMDPDSGNPSFSVGAGAKVFAHTNPATSEGLPSDEPFR